MSENDIYERLLYSMILKNELEFNAAVSDAARMNISLPQLQHIMEKIELWCRMKGLLPLKNHEHAALIKIQSFFRHHYVKIKLLEKYHLYCRLSLTDCEDYAGIALKYKKILKL